MSNTAASEKPMTQTTRSAPSAFETIKRENCFKGFYKLDKLHVRHELFAGGMSKEISRELFVRHDAVCVLPYDAKRDEVVLIEQFRVGAMKKTSNPWLVELVAGLIDKDEQPEEVAHREAEEEAGLKFEALCRSPNTSLRRVAATSMFTCFWGAARAKARAACTGWNPKAKTSGSRSGHSMTPCRR